MMFMPDLFRNEDPDLFDDVFNGSFFDYGVRTPKTDIVEKDGKYELSMELPGYKKEDIKISLNDGNLTVEAHHEDTQEEKDAKGNVIRRERYTGKTSRSFYIGEDIKDTDIKAEFKDGVLKLNIPAPKEIEANEPKYIGIE